MVNTELKAYGAFEQKKKLIAGIVLTGGGSNLKHLRQLANYTTGFDSRIGFANEYIANDKNQYLKGPEFATSIGLLMESLKIRDKKQISEIEEPVQEQAQAQPKADTATSPAETEQQTGTMAEQQILQQETASEQQQKRAAKLTFGQSLMEKVKKFFEEVE